jgi:hypothetical protein
MADVRSGVVEALRTLSSSPAGQRVITVGTEAVEVDWNPRSYHHHSLLLPLVLLTSALDHDAAQARWQFLSLAEVIGCAPQLDQDQKDILLALAGQEGAVNFGSELAAWIDRFGLAGIALDVDQARLDRGDHRGVRPISGALGKMPAVLARLETPRSLAALAVLALYNGEDTNKAFKGKRRATLNPPAVDGFAALREAAGPDAHAHLMRLIAAYRGW